MNCSKDKFEKIYVSYYPRLKRFAKEYLVSEEDAENIVQDVFLDIWEKDYCLSYSINLAAVLFTSVKNRCIDLLRRRVVRKNSETYIQDEFESTFRLKLQSLEAFEHDFFSESDVEKIITDAINSLPPQCREIFIKNKIEKIKQQDIAKEMGLSINTIESQMSIAYKKLRKELKDFLPLLIFLFG